MSPDNIDLRVLAERPVVRDDSPSEVDLVVHVATSRSIGDQPASHALNLCVVIDRSISMSGHKLEAAKQSCVEIWENLNPGDHFTVLAFDHDVFRVSNPQTPPDQVKDRIMALGAGGSTNLAKGWYLGLLELQSYSTDRHLNRMILLSDGQANQGETKPSLLGAESGRARDELGITTSTVGIGTDFQEDILAAIARASGGRFWYIGDSSIQDIIREEFSGALSVYLERPSVRLDLPAPASVVAEYHDLARVAGRYRLRPIKGNDRFAFGVRLLVDPAQVDGVELPVTATLLDGTGTVASTTTVLRLGGLAEYASSVEDPTVAMVISRYLTAKTDEEMVEQVDAGDVSTMITMLDKQSSLMMEIEGKLGGVMPLSWEAMTEAERLKNERLLAEQRIEREQLLRELEENESLRVVGELIDLVQGLGADDLVRDLEGRIRKHYRHRSYRDLDYHGHSPVDVSRDRSEVTGLLQAAIRVGQRVAADHPYAREEISAIVRRIGEQLVRLS
ncbi:vWA domain-containing protein [Micromonospora cathayae]|uniref:VWA domain-containing protein n=1 Tax=Micromonospora cathayae TaxID=3028804 RepID=A0ABY7ZW47_9ACTN|nr:VWA domain-containing protein [Micromonospora sp. HUAS 3]WDZ87274.1 VWA domain-containing protein [Micromonospora sp. HUAS 3]